jgi:DNA polymerase III epsilon subunit-like protein
MAGPRLAQVTFDLETTGFLPAARVVELFFLKLHPDGRREELHSYINPGQQIPQDATAVHGITDAMVRQLLGTLGTQHRDQMLVSADGAVDKPCTIPQVASAPAFEAYANQILAFCEGSDLHGYKVGNCRHLRPS